MKRTLLVLALVSVSGIASALAVGCSSSSTSGGGGIDAGTDSHATVPLDSGSGSTDSGTTTMGGDACVAPYDAAAYANSGCGHPGDKGNSIGVGSFCVTSNDCMCNSGANLCSTLGGPGTDFCTTLCMPVDGGGDAGCGENATCFCQGPGACGCTPNSCLSGPPPADAGSAG
jgi:hypothetical protein